MNQDYQKQTQDFLDLTGSTLEVKFLKHDKYFPDDKEMRDIYEIILKRANRSFVFTFGQSIFKTEEKESPTAYDILSCFTKYDPGTFENFCADYGYDTDSRKAEKIYNNVVKEYDNLKMLYSDKELELLAEIS